MAKIYDIAIIGSGFAGYTAGIYASRYKLSNVVFGDIFGGQTQEAHIIGNYPGFEEIKGPELIQKVRTHATNLGTEEIFERVVNVSGNQSEGFTLKTRDNNEYKAKFVLLTVGIKRRKLNITGEAELYGKGVTYCATCDGYFYKNMDVCVIGGSDAATTAALFLANIAKHVTLILRGPKLKGEAIWIDSVLANSNITVLYNTKVLEFKGTDALESIVISKENEQPLELPVKGAFIEVGHIPDTEFLKSLDLELDQEGFVIVQKDQSTSRNGIFAAGDVTNASNKFAQLLTAGSEASIAVNSIYEKIQTN